MGILESLHLRSKQHSVVYQAGDFKNSDGFHLYKPQLIEHELQSKTDVFEAGFFWEFPRVTFRALYEYYLKDPGIQSAVDAFRNEVMGAGFYVTADDGGAQKLIEDWNTDNDFEKKLFVMIGDLLILGSTIVEVLKSGTNFDVVPIDMRTIVAAQRDRFGKIEHYVQQTQRSQFTNLDAKKFIHFRLKDVGRQAWPIGIFHSAAEPFFEFENEPWSIADGASLIRQDSLRMVHKMAAPRVWHKYENVPEEFLKTQATRDKGMKPGERGYINQPFEIITEDIGATSRFRNEIDFITNAMENAVQSPTAKIMTATGINTATYASTESAKAMFEKYIRGYQRKWKQEIERLIYKPILELNGFDISANKLQFNWGSPEQVKIELDKLLAFRQTGDITGAEMRQILKDQGLPLSEEETPEEQQRQTQMELMKKQIKLLEKKTEESDAKAKLANKLLRGRKKE